MLPYKEKLDEILKLAVEFVETNLSEEVEDIDHAVYQTNDKNIFKEVYDNLSKSEKLVNEMVYSGRKMALFELNQPIKINDNYSVKRIEIEEPKPESQLKESFWETVAFKVYDFEKTLNKLTATKYELKKVRQVEDDRYGYLILDTLRIQLRNNFFGVDKKTSKTDSTDDYKKLYEEEKEKRLMALAEMDNEKKRIDRQREEFIKLANVTLLKEIFDVVDDLNRSLTHKPDDSIKMIYNKLLGILNNFGVVPTDVKEGDEFNPQKMEAISSIDSGAEKSKKVIHVEQTGFKLRDEDVILKTARVIVGK